MTNNVFISYSRKDQEYVRKLAEDLDQRLDGGVWFDQSDIQAGDKWRERLVNGIREAHVVVLVLSPDAAVSKYVLMELNVALETGKKVIPILYRPVKLQGELDEFVRETQFIDLQRGSYADNFQLLVDALVFSGVARADEKRPFLRRPVKTDWGTVLKRIPGWGFAWSIGWAIFWFVLYLLMLLVNTNEPAPFILGLLFSFGGLIGGGLGGLVAGLVTMLSLRRNAPSIAWRHMSPSIRIWMISGPLGAILSVLVALALPLAVDAPDPDCSSLNFGQCLGAGIGSAIGEAIGTIILLIFVILLFLLAAWFFTGVFAGWFAVRHIRRLEPGITRGQSGWVMFGWGLGGLVGTILSLTVAAILSNALGL